MQITFPGYFHIPNLYRFYPPMQWSQVQLHRQHRQSWQSRNTFELFCDASSRVFGVTDVFFEAVLATGMAEVAGDGAVADDSSVIVAILLPGLFLAEETKLPSFPLIGFMKWRPFVPMLVELFTPSSPLVRIGEWWPVVLFAPSVFG